MGPDGPRTGAGIGEYIEQTQPYQGRLQLTVIGIQNQDTTQLEQQHAKWLEWKDAEIQSLQAKVQQAQEFKAHKELEFAGHIANLAHALKAVEPKTAAVNTGTPATPEAKPPAQPAQTVTTPEALNTAAQQLMALVQVQDKNQAIQVLQTILPTFVPHQGTKRQAECTDGTANSAKKTLEAWSLVLNFAASWIVGIIIIPYSIMELFIRYTRLMLIMFQYLDLATTYIILPLTNNYYLIMTVLYYATLMT